MNNAFKVLLRDLKRFARVPQAILILVGIIIIPSLYAWFNIVAFWDPYGNTKEVDVAIVNLDKGTTSELTGPLNVGDKVVAQLKENDQLGWKFMDEKEGMHAVRSGEVFATIVIHEDFTSDLLTLTTGDFVRPELDYFVNEKANAIAPKITEVGASTLETQINETFVSTVAQTISEAAEQAGDELGQKLLSVKAESENVLGTAMTQLAGARTGLSDLNASLVTGEVALADVSAALTSVEGSIDSVQAAITETEAIVAQVQTGLVGFTDSVTQAFVTGSAELTGISGKLNQRLAALTGGASQASAVIGSAVADAQAVVDTNSRAIAKLVEARDALEGSDPQRPVLDSLITQLQDRNTADQQLLGQLSDLNGQVAQLTADIQASADALNTTVSETAAATAGIRDVTLNTIPEINRSMSALSASAGGFSSSLGAQRVMIEQSVSLIASLETQLAEAKQVGIALDASLAGVEADLRGVTADVNALSSADLLQHVEALSGLDPKQIASFMSSPVVVKQHTLFPVAAYGSAMAPLFTNLSIWIGAFVLVVLLKQEVDTEGIKNLTVRQAYMGRFMLLAVLNFFQALLVSVGNVIIGVQMANAFAYVATSVFVGFVFMSIIYALAVSFGYIGKGIAILLVIIQIPGASGIYPIEMMPDFFRALFPFFPFTYGIDAMRETIAGFYGADYWRSFGVLVLFAAIAFTVGLFFRQRLGNFSRLFNSKASITGLFASENVQVLGSRRRVTQIVQALTNRDAFRKKTARQAEWFEEHHLTVLRLTLLAGVVLTALLALMAWLMPEAKASVLGLWGLLCLLLIATVVTIEYIKQSVGFAKTVGELNDEELQQRLEEEERSTHSDAVLDQIRERV